MRDPAPPPRRAILLGSLTLLLTLGCCAVTLLGWLRGALEALS